MQLKIKTFVSASALLITLAAHAQLPANSSDTATARPARNLHYVVIHRPGPAWEPNKSPFEQPGMQGHVDHYRTLRAEGKLLLGGPFMDKSGGGMMISEAGVSEREISEFAATDPVVKSGVLTFEVRPWMIGMRK
jgi:uncharacterized protein YciI